MRILRPQQLALVVATLAMLGPVDTSRASERAWLADAPETMARPGDLHLVREALDPASGHAALTLRYTAASVGEQAWVTAILRLDGARVANVAYASPALGVGDAVWALDPALYAADGRGLEGNPETDTPAGGALDVLRWVPGSDTVVVGFAVDGASDPTDEVRIEFEPGPNVGDVEVHLELIAEAPADDWPASSIAPPIVVGRADADFVADDGRYLGPRVAVRCAHEDLDVRQAYLVLGSAAPGSEARIDTLMIEACFGGEDPDGDDPSDRNGALAPPCTEPLLAVRALAGPLVSAAGTLPGAALRVDMPPMPVGVSERAQAAVIVSVPESATAGTYHGTLSVFEDNDGTGSLTAGDTFDTVVVEFSVTAPTDPDPSDDLGVPDATVGTDTDRDAATGGDSDPIHRDAIDRDDADAGGRADAGGADGADGNADAATDAETARPPSGDRHLRGGDVCACTTSRTPVHGPSWPGVGLALLALGLLCRGRRRWRALRRLRGVSLGLLALCLVALATEPATAQSVDADPLRPAGVAADSHVAVDYGRVLGHLRVAGVFELTYANRPVELWEDGARVESPVAHRLFARAAGAIGLGDWVELGVAVPAALFQDGSGAAAAAALGDVTASVRVGLPDGVRGRWRAALNVDTTAPSATDPSIGRGRWRSGVGAVVGVELGPVTVALDLGGRFTLAESDASDVAPVDIAAPDHELKAALGLVWAPAEAWRVGAELTSATDLRAAFETDGRTGAETLGFAEWRSESGVYLVAAAGLGIVPGAGVPAWRATTGVGFRQPTEAAAVAELPSLESDLEDGDRDGIVGDADACPTRPEDFDGFADEDGCPDEDNDGDGIRDPYDRAPDLAEDLDGFRDGDGVPDLDNDLDGVPDADDRCPLEPEDRDGRGDSDGCPDPDDDGDGFSDAVDACPETPGTNGGCP